MKQDNTTTTTKITATAATTNTDHKEKAGDSNDHAQKCKSCSPPRRVFALLAKLASGVGVKYFGKKLPTPFLLSQETCAQVSC
jgi:hypothetical protein